MLTGDIRNQVDQIWNSFWTGGIANPLEVADARQGGVDAGVAEADPGVEEAGAIGTAYGAVGTPESLAQLNAIYDQILNRDLDTLSQQYREDQLGSSSLSGVRVDLAHSPEALGATQRDLRPNT